MTQPYSLSPEPPKSNKSPVAIVAIAAVVVLIIIAAAYFAGLNAGAGRAPQTTANAQGDGSTSSAAAASSASVTSAVGAADGSTAATASSETNATTAPSNSSDSSQATPVDSGGVAPEETGNLMVLKDVPKRYTRPMGEKVVTPNMEIRLSNPSVIPIVTESKWGREKSALKFCFDVDMTVTGKQYLTLAGGGFVVIAQNNNYDNGELANVRAEGKFPTSDKVLQSGENYNGPYCADLFDDNKGDKEAYLKDYVIVFDRFSKELTSWPTIQWFGNL